MPEFVPGIDLARGYYAEVVRPVIEGEFPDLPYSVALLGFGSDVLGFDTERSSDHVWGPRLFLFVDPADRARHGAKIGAVLDARIPETYRGWPTRFQPHELQPVSLRVEVRDAHEWCTQKLGFDPADGVTLRDWLSTPTQLLLEATAGEVFHDGLDALERRRRALAWYPSDVWRYVVGCQWSRVAQEEPFVGRAGEVGDDLGSRVVAARLVRDLMRLCFLLEQKYAPYSKWLGHAFERLDCAPRVGPLLARALGAATWQRREAALGAAAEAVADIHNRCGIGEPVDATLRPFYERPFLVLDSGRFAAAAFDSISDPEVAALPRGVGAIDQWADSTDVLSWPARTRAAEAWVVEP